MTTASLNVQASDSNDGKIVHKMFKKILIIHSQKKRYKSCHWGSTFSKGIRTNMCTFGANVFL